MLALLSLLMTCYAYDFDENQFKNTSVERSVNLTGMFCEVTNHVTIHNKGDSTASKYFYTMPLDNHEKLAHIYAKVEGDNINLLDIDFVETTENYALYKIKMPRGVKPGNESILHITEVLSQKMVPFPRNIGIFDEQLLKYEDNVHFFSPYKTDESNISIEFPNESVESYTKLAGSKLKSNTLTYAAYTDIAPYSIEPIVLHFNHNTPLPYFSDVERSIEVSHWGNVAINEVYSLVNRGANLTGEFDRIDFLSKHQASALNALESLEAILPKHAWGLSFRDEIGNVSTSHARQHHSYVHMEIEPRFPLLGGWKYRFQIGYNLPIKYFVSQKEDLFMLNTTFGFPFKQIIAENLTVKVILPEGAKDVKSYLPFKVEDEHQDLEYSYLDTIGRPVLVLEKRNAADFHRKPFQVLYNYSTADMLREPLMLIGGAAVLLLMLVLYFRIDSKYPKNEERKVKYE